MKKYLILSNEVTEDCCSDLIGKVLLGEYDGEEFIQVYPNTKWLLKEGYKDDYILFLPSEVQEIE